jgi:sialic acid synthase SpsE
MPKIEKMIIAEIGSNFTDIKELLDSIAAAKLCGADAVKFQHFEAKEMYAKDGTDLLPEHFIEELAERAHEYDLKFGCTFFNPEKLTKYLPLLDFIKIASSNMMDKRLLDIAKSANKHTIISTGGHSGDEFMEIYNYMKPTTLIDFLYCESSYPSHINNYRKFDAFPFSGISDHSLDVYPNYPENPDCWIYEKHVNFFHHKTPDAGHSLDEHDFKAYVKHVRGRQPTELFSQDELSMRDHYNVRLVATKDIHAGDKFDYRGNFDVLRCRVASRQYLNGMQVELINGKFSRSRIEAGNAISARDI